jgi:hypothetical protein
VGDERKRGRRTCEVDCRKKVVSWEVQRRCAMERTRLRVQIVLEDNETCLQTCRIIENYLTCHQYVSLIRR